MTLPASSSYEELLEQVRKLTDDTILIQEQMSPDLFSSFNAADVNQNHALLQQDADAERHSLSTSQTLCWPDHSLYQSRSRNSLPANLSVGIKIPPGDLKSRLIAWREKKSQLQSLHQQYQHQQDQPRGGEGVESRQDNGSSTLPRKRADLETGSASSEASSLLRQELAAPDKPSYKRASCLLLPPSDDDDDEVEEAAAAAGQQEESITVTDYLPSPPQLFTKNVQNYGHNRSNTEEESRPSSSLQSESLTKIHGSWPVKDLGVAGTMHNEVNGTMSFSSGAGMSSSSEVQQGQNRLGAKMDVVYNLLSMLGSSEDRDDMSATLLSMSNSIDSCIVMRQSGCLPLLIQLIHAPGQNPETRERASRALYNIVHARTDEKSSKREIRVLRLLEQLRDYCQALRNALDTRQQQQQEDLERHPGNTIAALMKLSFDETHRQAMCQLGGLHAVAELIEMDHVAHGSNSDDQNCVTLRRYAGMALTNLTFGDGNNKALLCSFREFMKALVSQLQSPSDDLRQVTASVLRNLSWRADSSSKQTLREVGAVVSLMKAAMEGRKEATLKSILSALWNLSAHCRTNKMDICAVEGALAFLVDMLNYNAPSKTLAIIENAGGILRNVSSYIAMRDDYRAIVRDRGCLQVLLKQLRSPSLTVVSNACGTLWNLSARCPQDQRLLWELGAVPMLRSLIHSKHKMISMGSSAALKNLFNAAPSGTSIVHMDSTARGLGLPSLPSLAARKQKALEQEIDQNLAETCDNIEPSNSPVNKEDKFSFKLDQSFLEASNKAGKTFNQLRIPQPVMNQAGPSSSKCASNFTRSESRESMRSVTSTQSDTIFEKVNRQARSNMLPSELQIKQQSTSLHSAVNFDDGEQTVGPSKGLAEKKYTLRYMNAIPERLKPGEPLPDLRGLKCSTSTISWSVTPNQDATCSKGLLNSSIEDNLSMSNSCDYLSNSKTIINSDSSSCNFLTARSKSISPFSGTANLPLKCSRKSVSPVGNLFNNSIETDLEPLADYSFKSTEKNSSKYAQDDSKVYRLEGTPCQRSLTSSGVSSASDLHDENRFKSAQSTQDFSHNISLNAQHSFNISSQNDDCKMDSLHSARTSESGLTLEADRSLDSDTAVFEQNYNLSKNSNIKKFNNDQDCLDTVNKLTEYLNKVKNINGDPTSESYVSVNEQFQADEDYSEMTQTNDYYTVQETYTLEKNPKKSSENVYINDDCSLSEQCSSTLSFMTIDDENTLPISKNQVEPSEGVIKNIETATASNSESCESFDSIERSEQVLLELCIKSGMSKAETLLSMSSSDKLKLSDEMNNLSKQKFTLQQKEGEVVGKKQEQEEYRRQRDPDAMIASLDRLTAALVQQSEAMRERDSSTMKASLMSDCTWNEDSPNDASFPSISVSAPLVASFKSDLPDQELSVNENSQDSIAEKECHSLLQLSSDSMTESKIIQMEAIKLAEAVSAEANSISLASLDLDAINPPSTMGSLVSLTASIGGIVDNNFADHSGEKSQSNSLPAMQLSSNGRKRSLPIGVVARRALCQGHSRTASLENLLNECNSNISQLDNVKPPSIMDELLDAGDMENSMLSVASITSEIADHKENESNSLTLNADVNFDLIKPVANVLSMTCMKYVTETMHGSASSSLSECLENINPPSLFNEVSQMDESTIDSNTHCNDTLCIDVELNSEKTAKSFCAVDERIEEIAYDTDEAITPISSEYNSSVESTPKRRFLRNQSGHLTPKQKRQLAKERYKTYTIAAERVKKEQEDLKRQEQANRNEAENTAKYSALPKITPKQRRQEDRARFQTQILDNSILDKTVTNDNLESESSNSPSTEKLVATSTNQSPAKSGIPMLKKFPNYSKTYKIKRNSQGPQTSEKYCAKTLTTNETISSNNYEMSNISAIENTDILSVGNKEVISFGSEKSNSPSSMINAALPETNGNENILTDKVRSQQTLSPNKSVQSVKQNSVDNVRDDLNEYQSNSESESGDDDEDDSSEKEETRRVRGPRIVKPGTLSRDLSVESNATDKSEPEIPKAIRGRRKPLYAKPSTRISVTPQSSPLKQPTTSVTPISRSNSSPVVRATRAMTLRQHNSIQKTNAYNSGTPEKRSSSANTPTSSKRTAIPQKSSLYTMTKRPTDNLPKSETPVKGLERQGTFTKDEPEMDNVPTVLSTSPCKGKLQKPSKPVGKLSPKTSPVHGKLKPSLKIPQKYTPSKLTKTTSAEKIATGTNIPMIAKRASTNLCSPVVKSSSNYQISNGNESGIPRKISLGQRSNSNSSIVSNVSNQGNRKVKEAASKIATLWKKVEENKNKQRFERPDARQWITPNSRTLTQVQSPRSERDQTCSLYRSSTFEGITKASENSSQCFATPTGKLTTV